MSLSCPYSTLTFSASRHLRFSRQAILQDLKNLEMDFQCCFCKYEMLLNYVYFCLSWSPQMTYTSEFLSVIILKNYILYLPDLEKRLVCRENLNLSIY